jgi:hypothetical protein
MKFTFLLYVIMFLAIAGQAQTNLITRQVITAQDSLCTYSNKNIWNTVQVFPNGLKYPSTTSDNSYVDYKFNLQPGLVGEVEILVFKNLPEPVNKSDGLDDQALVIIQHAGIKDSLTNSNFFADKDGWYSLGKFRFDGDTEEFLRVKRVTKKSNNYTIAPTFRFDWYFDLKTRVQKPDELRMKSPIGFTTMGNWGTSARKGFSNSNAKESVTKGAKAIWNPGKLPKGKTAIYIYKPNVKSMDRYEIFHDGKVEEIFLDYREYANFKMYNPVALQGWFKIGEFEVSGNGNEFILLTKTANDSTYADCVYYESVDLDGTLVNRIVVTPKSFEGETKEAKATITLAQKENQTKIDPGFSPIYNEDDISTSMKNGYTFYGRAYWLKSGKGHYFWNPLITEPGNYDVYYYTYYPVKNSGKFTVVHNGKEDVIELGVSSFGNQNLCKLGNFSFSGGIKDEYVIMSGLDRASDMMFVKTIGEGSILRQRIVTGHPYFIEITFEDTKQHHFKHDISFMVLKGFVQPEDEFHFNPEATVSVSFFSDAIFKMLTSRKNAMADSSLFTSYESVSNCLLFGLPDQLQKQILTWSAASKILLNATEFTGKYQNVKNFFVSNETFTKTAQHASIPDFAKEAFEKLPALGIVSAGQPNQYMTKADATHLLKEFLEQVLQSGPPTNSDWELTFSDDFNGKNIDYSKWNVTNTIRFKGLSAKWAENSVVENGVYKGYNFFDNHQVPYSSGEIISKFKQTNGFFEARYKYPDRAYGSHSSFWTSSPGGDFNYNEGTYPNGISHNNYFMSSFRDLNFKTRDNLSRDFHTISGCLDSVDLFCGFDGQITYEVKNYPQYYGKNKTTQVPYGFWMSTIVTYFDGPLDRDRIDGSFMSADWIRVYKKIIRQPAIQKEAAFPPDKSYNVDLNVLPVLKFNKPVNTALLNKQQIIVSAGKGVVVPEYSIKIISPVRVQLVFNHPLSSDCNYIITIKKGIKDLTGNESVDDESVTFKTKAGVK